MCGQSKFVTGDLCRHPVNHYSWNLCQDGPVCNQGRASAIVSMLRIVSHVPTEGAIMEAAN